MTFLSLRFVPFFVSRQALDTPNGLWIIGDTFQRYQFPGPPLFLSLSVYLFLCLVKILQAFVCINRYYYTVYDRDQNRVGFATANLNPGRV
jgi:hypothetical protein